MSTASLEAAVTDEAGVQGVRVREAGGGDDDVPFVSIPQRVFVRMDPDVTAAQVAAVFTAYDDAVDDGDVQSVEVVLVGPRRATLATGEGVHATDAMTEDLVGAQRDDDIIRYRAEAYPVLPSVHVTLGPGTFDEVVDVADRYRYAEWLDSVTVVSGQFLLIRDEVNDDVARTDARIRYVRDLSGAVDLRGAVVTGRGPLELAVGPDEVQPLREYLDEHVPAPAVGRVRIDRRASP